MCKLSVISQEWLKIVVKLLLSANRKSYIPRRLAQQRMTLRDIEWPFHASRAISTVAELLVYYVYCFTSLALSGRLNCFY